MSPGRVALGRLPTLQKYSFFSRNARFDHLKFTFRRQVIPPAGLHNKSYRQTSGCQPVLKRPEKRCGSLLNIVPENCLSRFICIRTGGLTFSLSILFTDRFLSERQPVFHTFAVMFLCFQSFPLQKSISSSSGQPASFTSLRNRRAHISASSPARWCCPQGISNRSQR